MTPEELFEELSRRVRDPRQLIVYLWFAWWVWSVIRGKLRRRPEQPDTERAGEPADRLPAPSRSEAESRTRVDSPSPSPGPVPGPGPSRIPGPGPSRVPGPDPSRIPSPRSSRFPTPSRSPTPSPTPARTDSPWTRSLDQAHALRSQLESDRALRRLEPIAVYDVIDPLQSAVHDARKPQPDARIQARAARAVATLAVLERIVRERASDGAARLAELDAIADACHAPLRSHARAEGLPLRGVHPVAMRAPLPHAGDPPEYSDQLLLLPLRRAFGAHLNDYTAALHELGRRWYHGLPELAAELESELGVSPRMRLLQAHDAYDAASVQAHFGPWLPSLFADTALTLRLGSGYATGLRKSFLDDAQPTRARAQGSSLGDRPPSLLRMRAAMNALAALGQHDEAERQAQAFAAEHEGLERSYLPLADGRALVLDSSYLLDFTDLACKAMLDSAHAALGGAPLAAAPGLSQSLEDRRTQRELALAIAGRRVPERPDAVQLLCGALLAWDAGTDPQLALAALQGALAPRAAAPAPAARAPQEAAAPRSLRAALHDRALLRTAITLGAAFERPRSEGRRSF